MRSCLVPLVLALAAVSSAQTAAPTSGEEITKLVEKLQETIEDKGSFDFGPGDSSNVNSRVPKIDEKGITWEVSETSPVLRSMKTKLTSSVEWANVKTLMVDKFGSQNFYTVTLTLVEPVKTSFMVYDLSRTVGPSGPMKESMKKLVIKLAKRSDANACRDQFVELYRLLKLPLQVVKPEEE